ncbi:uncharacterized protein PAC_03324 [Phialocephala subalpina]|uniref:Phytocyanin domain-containing protein n=1 Tax=Phialocephala subalpina TaxID=576137 RepID=A0A1L7WL08_9HELO|nr:uncharacterized protein PAC_03324 [Phialocephala subalpina]
MGTKKPTGFNSGPIKNQASEGPNVFQVEVKDKNQIWFYCGTTTHCQAGMNGAMNAPDTENKLDAYRTAAADTSSSESLPTVQGDVIAPEETAPSSGGDSSLNGASSSKPATSAPTSSSTGTSAGSTSGSNTGSTAVAPTSTGAPLSKTMSAATSQSIIPASGGSTLAGKTVLVGVVVAGLEFLVMLA